MKATDKLTIEYNQVDNTYTYKHTTEGEHYEETVSPDEIMAVLSGHYHLNRPNNSSISSFFTGTPDAIFNASTYMHGNNVLFEPHVTEADASPSLLIRSTVAQLTFVHNLLDDTGITDKVTSMMIHTTAKILDQLAWDMLQSDRESSAESNGNEVVGQGEVESSSLN